MRQMGFALLGLWLSHHAAAAPPSVMDFARHAEFGEVAISPDGRSLAVSVIDARSRGIGVIDLDDMRLAFSVSPGDEEHVFELNWVSDRRLLVSLASSRGWGNGPAPTGELMAIDRDGGNGRYLYGVRGARAETKHNPDPTRRMRHARQIAAWPDAADFALIQSYSYYEPVGVQFAFVERLDVRNGRTRWAAQAPLRGPVRFVADRAGQVRYAQGRGDAPGVFRTFLHDPQAARWHELDSDDPLADFDPLTVSDDGGTGYLRVREHGDRYCLERQSLADRSRERLACHPQADLADILVSPTTGHAVGARFDPGVPEIRWLGTDDPDEALLRRIAAQLAGHRIELASRSRDATRFVIKASSDTDPGRFYLYDRRTDSLRFLLARRAWIDPQAMPPRRVVHWQARDGTALRGYLTAPRAADGTALPLVVMPHGGPFDVRDTWDWQAEPALLASRGYAVFQPQFRGSAGFGRAFRDAARRQLGTRVIDDITDGVRALIERGVADPARIGLMGHSFGGYAALASAVREPTLYRCMVGIAGIYDLRRYARTVRSQAGADEARFVDAFVGESAELLDAQSPIRAIDALRLPVMLFHGGRDGTVDPRESRALYAALRDRDMPVTLEILDDEDHFIFDVRTRERMFAAIVAFFERHLREPPTKKGAD